MTQVARGSGGGVAGVGGWVLHVARRRGGHGAGRGEAGEAGGADLLPALADRGLARATVRVGPGGWLRAAADAPRIARRLRRRPDPAEAPVRWPEAGPVPVLHAHDSRALRAAWLALCLTGAPARLTARWTGPAPPPDPGIWRRLDAAMAGGPAAARALRAAGLEGRRIRVVEGAGGLEPLLAVYRELTTAPLARTRRVDWSLR